MRDGPVGATLDEIASEVGLTGPALSQRFGSKRGLLVAMAKRGAAAVPRRFASARDEAAGPTESLHVALAATGLEAPGEVAASLGMLALDLSDDEFRAIARSFFDSFHAEVRALLAEAVKARELRSGDVDALARSVVVAYNGSILRWAFLGGEAAGEAMRRDVEAVLAPWRVGKALPRRGK